MEKFNKPIIDNEIVGYYNRMYIIKREDGELFYCEMPQVLSIGDIFLDDLTSINELSPAQQSEIIALYGN